MSDTPTLARRIVNLSESIKQLKTAQIACGNQYKMFPQQITHELTITRPQSYVASYNIIFEFSDTNPFVLFGITSVALYKNGTQLTWSGTGSYYGTEYEKTSDGLGVTLEQGWYVGTTEKMGNELVLTYYVPTSYTAGTTLKIVINGYTTLPGFFNKTFETEYL